jgi:diadenosine tetraphosphate (Ap4A) HIT family hydrolase
MARLGDAVLAVTGAERVNYEILGNVEPALHAHVSPRYSWEAPATRRTPVWLHDWAAAPAFDPERDRPLAGELARYLAAER